MNNSTSIAEELETFHQEWLARVQSGGKSIKESDYAFLGRCYQASSQSDARVRVAEIALELLRFSLINDTRSTSEPLTRLDLQWANRLYDIAMLVQPDDLETVLQAIILSPIAPSYLSSRAVLHYLNLTGKVPKGSPAVVERMLLNVDDSFTQDDRLKKFADSGLFTLDMVLLAMKNPAWTYATHFIIVGKLIGKEDQNLVAGLIEILAQLCPFFPATESHIGAIVRTLLMLPRSTDDNRTIVGHLWNAAAVANESQTPSWTMQRLHGQLIRFGELNISNDQLTAWDAMQAHCLRQGFGWQDVLAILEETGAIKASDEAVAMQYDLSDEPDYAERLIMLFDVSGYVTSGGIRDLACVEMFKLVAGNLRPSLPIENLSWSYSDRWQVGANPRYHLIAKLGGTAFSVVACNVASEQFQKQLADAVEIVTFDFQDKAFCFMAPEDPSMWETAWLVHDVFNCFLAYVGRPEKTYYLSQVTDRWHLFAICANAESFVKANEKLKLPFMSRDEDR